MSELSTPREVAPSAASGPPVAGGPVLAGGEAATRDSAMVGLEVQPPSPRTMRRVMLSGAAGFFMETYDFGIYGLVAAYLSVEFFASADATTSLLITWIVFAIPFLVRPIGGLILGRSATGSAARRSCSSASWRSRSPPR